MTFGSLFAGIGGMDLGLERAGMQCKWQVEIDPWCQRVLAKHWPDVLRHADVREVGPHNLEPVDLICGGFPCQDISVAGKGAGIEGERSGLWWEFHRIIGELRPRYVLVENVGALVVRGLDAVLGALAESGYDASWDHIPAAAVGAPHRRDRIFLVAYANHQGKPDVPVHAEPWGGVSESSESHVADTKGQPQRPGLCEDESRGERGRRPGDGSGPGDVAYAGRELLEGREPARTAHRSEIRRNAEWWATEPDVGRVAHGVPARVDRLKGLGNAVVPQAVEYIGRLIMEAHRGTKT